jgi:hypothetical protein
LGLQAVLDLAGRLHILSDLLPHPEDPWCRSTRCPAVTASADAEGLSVPLDISIALPSLQPRRGKRIRAVDQCSAVSAQGRSE